MKVTDWFGCYDDGWKGLITDESFSHPAKFSRGLVFRIVEYLLKSGMVQPGDTVIDPFGGVGLGALPCLLNGLNWIGNELEEKFVEMGRKNIDLWNTKFSSMPKWTGQAVLLRGDSRKLTEVIQQAGVVVSSPPYSTGQVQDRNGIDASKFEKYGPNSQAVKMQAYGATPGQLASLPEGKLIVSSPPYSSGIVIDHDTIEKYNELKAKVVRDGNGHAGRFMASADGYGKTNGQLGAMPASVPGTGKGRPVHPDPCRGVVSSPPFAGNTGGRGEASRNGIDPALFDRHQGAMVGGIGSAGNLAGMKPGEVAVVTSPPYEDGVIRKRKGGNADQIRQATNGAVCWGTIKNGQHAFDEYGQAAGQLGTESGETFWSAARLILSQCYQLLPPGAPAVFVVKSFVRDGQIVDFPGQWQQLCEACGFETVEVIRAWLVKDKGTQIDLNGNGHKKTVARKSFFRRLAEAKGSPAIDFETVLVTRRLPQ